MARLLDAVVGAGAFRDRPQPTLIVDDLAVRPWTASDAPVLARAYDDPAIQQWHHRAMTQDEAVRWIAEAGAAWYRETDAGWAVTRADEVVGRVALHGVELAIGQAGVSYWTVPAARARGVARRAVDRVARWALDEVGLWRLHLTHSTRNEASCRVAEATGFAFEATLRRCHLHADGWHDVHIHTRFR